MIDDEDESRPDDTEMPEAIEPTAEDDRPFDDDDADVSAEVQSEVNRLEQAVWHAPQGKGTRVAAVLILVLIAGCLIGLTVLAIVTAMS